MFHLTAMHKLLKLILITRVALPGRGGGQAEGDSRITCLNFKRSCVGALSMFHVAVTVAVGNLKKGCHLSRFYFKCCLYFLGHVACRNLPWQSLTRASDRPKALALYVHEREHAL